MTTEYIIQTAREIGTLSRYDPSYYDMRRMAVLLDGLLRRKVFDKKADTLERRTYRDSVGARERK